MVGINKPVMSQTSVIVCSDLIVSYPSNSEGAGI